MLSFEEKRAIFLSFQLKEKPISNGRMSFVYPESKQRGQVLATQLHPSGNGYVIGKYMPEETIQNYGYEVDSRGWITIKEFTKDELLRVIALAIKSMGGTVEPAEKKNNQKYKDNGHEVKEDIVAQQETEPAQTSIQQETEPAQTSLQHEVVPEQTSPQREPYLENTQPQHETAPIRAEKQDSRKNNQKTIKNHEPITCTLLYGWLGLTLTAIEYSSAFWKKVRKYSLL